MVTMGGPVASGHGDDLAPAGERIAPGMADALVHRLFAVGLDLHAALTYIEADIAGDATIEKIHKAISGLDGAIRDFRGVVFDLHPAGPATRASLRALIVEAVERACGPGGACPALTLGHGMESVLDRRAWQQAARLIHRTLALLCGERLADAHVVVTADPRPPARLVMHIDGPVRDLAGMAGRLRALDRRALTGRGGGSGARQDGAEGRAMSWHGMDVSCQTLPRSPDRSRIRLEWPMTPH